MNSKDNITEAKYEIHEEATPKEDIKEGVSGEPKILDQDNVADILLLLGSSKAANELKAHNAQHRDAGRMPLHAVSKPPSSISTKGKSSTPRAENAQHGASEDLEESAEFSDIEEDDEYSVEEDEFMEDVEDDEWIETLRISSQFTRRISANEVLKRKKAPSGSACEKHKRWKKRCPDDCPLRKAKWRYSSQASYKQMRSSTKVTSPAHSLKKEDIEQVIALINSSRTDQWEIAAPKLQTVLRNLEKCVQLSHSLSSISPSVAHQRADYVLLIRYVMKNILLDKAGEETARYVEEIEKRALCNEVSPPLSDEVIQQMLSRCPSIDSMSRRAKRKMEAVAGEEDSREDKKRKKEEKKKVHEKILTIACEKHTIMHARCPPQCPDRRPAKDRPPRGRKPKHVKLAMLAAASAASNANSASTSSSSSTNSSSSQSAHAAGENTALKFQRMQETIASRVALEESRWRNVNKGRGYDAKSKVDTNTDNSAADSDSQSEESNHRLPSIAEMTKHMCDSDTDEENAPKLMKRSDSFPFVEGYLDISNQNLLKSAARRYLPKACDKHKIMHANC